jgi:putative aldouronate transport system substrate-binding protein
MAKNKLVAIIVTIILITGCNSQPNTTTPPIVFTVLYNEKEETPFQDDWLILEEYKKRKNVILDVRRGDDAAYEKDIFQALESSDIPDIILKVWPKPLETYANDGVLLPFSDYEHLMPNYQAYIDKNNLQAEVDKLRLSNGKYYVLPGYQRKIQVQQWIYRQDVFEENGLQLPQTYDDLYNSLVLLKGKYPDSTPLTAVWGGAHLFAMMGAGYGIPAGWAGTRHYNANENLWQFSPATENYRALYRFLNQCYEAGILDPMIFTQSDTEFYDKLQDGRAFVTVTWITSGFDNWNTQLRENGIVDGEWAPLPVPESTIGIRALPAVDPYRVGLTVPAQVTNTPYFQDLLRFLDWAVYSEESRTLTTWGIEGLTYENTSTGKAFLPDIKTPKNPDGTIDLAKEYGLDTFFNLVENEEFEDYKKPPEIVAFLQRSLKAEETAQLSPQLILDDPSLDASRIINEKLDPYVASASTQFITGDLDIDSDWDAYIFELENRGYQALEDIWNSAWRNQNQ